MEPVINSVLGLPVTCSILARTLRNDGSNPANKYFYYSPSVSGNMAEAILPSGFQQSGTDLEIIQSTGPAKYQVIIDDFNYDIQTFRSV
jgi:hypothetical protein